MEPISLPGLAQENNEGFVEYYDRWLINGEVHHRLTHVVTADGETLRSPERTPAEKMRRYLTWRAGCHTPGVE